MQVRSLHRYGFHNDRITAACRVSDLSQKPCIPLFSNLPKAATVHAGTAAPVAFGNGEQAPRVKTTKKCLSHLHDATGKTKDKNNVVGLRR
jgi:hypothetical protein